MKFFEKLENILKRKLIEQKRREKRCILKFMKWTGII